MNDKPHVGFIGLGVMGSRMAKTLARAGYALDVFDVDHEKIDAVTAAGATAAGSPGAVARKSDVVFSSLPWPATVREVYLGAGGGGSERPPGTISSTRARWTETRARSTPPPLLATSSISTLRERRLSRGRERHAGRHRRRRSRAFDKAKECWGVLGSTVHYAGCRGGEHRQLVNNVMSMGNSWSPPRCSC